MSNTQRKPARPANQVLLAVPATIAASDDGKHRKVSGVAYSGEVLTYWGSSIVIDLATAKAASRTPLLIEHDRAQRAGFAALSIDQNGIQLEGELLDNAHGKAVADDADGGFPWQLSVHVEASSVEEVVRGAFAKVNGQKVAGPATIMRGALVREVSFTPTGVDPKTHAAVFAAAPITEDPNMSDNTELQAEVDQLKAQVADLTAKLSATAGERDAEKARADEAQAKLGAQVTAARTAEVKSLFAALKREYTDDAAKPYIAMDDAAFAAVSADLKASSKVQLPAHLTRETATDGALPGGLTGDDAADPQKIALAINQRITLAAREGRTLTVLEASREVRAAQAA